MVALCFVFFIILIGASELSILSLHDALPICGEHRHLAFAEKRRGIRLGPLLLDAQHGLASAAGADTDRKSTRLNSSHLVISYDVFCLKKKYRRAHVSISL